MGIEKFGKIAEVYDAIDEIYSKKTYDIPGSMPDTLNDERNNKYGIVLSLNSKALNHDIDFAIVFDFSVMQLVVHYFNGNKTAEEVICDIRQDGMELALEVVEQKIDRLLEKHVEMVNDKDKEWLT